MEDWLAVVAVCSVPFIAFGLIELCIIYKRRHAERLARRPKGRF